MKRFILITGFLALISGISFSQGISFTAQAPRQVLLGQRFYLTFTVNQEGSNFISPEISHFDVLGGPSVQSGRNIQMVNGKVSESIYFNYTFILQATDAGTFTIPPASITVEGKKYQSNPVAITVSGQNPSPSARQQKPQIQDQGNPGNDLFLKLEISNPSPYLGEQVILTCKLYTPTSRLKIVPANAASYQGFWAQDLQKNLTQYPQYKETVNGKTYIVAEIRKVALFPQKTGSVTISPVEQDVIYQVRTKAQNPFGNDPFFNDSFFNDFFNNSAFGFDVQEVQKTLKSNALTLDIKPLPVQQKPIEYSGAVGSFSFNHNLSHTTINVNDAITLSLTIKGSGNLNLLEKPAVNFPPDFEVYDPKIIDNINSGNGGISGSRTFEYLVIPRTAGDFKIDPVSFAYFDPGKRSYTTLWTPAFTIQVKKGTGTVTAGNTPRQDVRDLGSDIRYLKEGSLGLVPIGTTFYGSNLFWLILSLPVLLFLLFIIFWRNYLKTHSDIRLLKQRKATAVATRRLRTAKKFLDNQSAEPFYVEISAALWGYLGDKFGLPLSSLSMDNAASELARRNVDTELVTKFMSTLNNCEYARFAPGEKNKIMEELYSEAIEVITLTESQLK